MKKIFPPNTIKTLYRREKNLTEVLSPSLFPWLSKLKILLLVVTNVIFVRIFLHLTLNSNIKLQDIVYNIKGKLTCNTPNVVYLISCFNSYDRYVGSALDFKSRFRIHKSDIKTKKGRCGTARYFNTKCTDSFNPHKFLKVQIIQYNVITI